ncbi:MAG TPA: DUF2889 domain-containing protein [Mycobacteriales bacterium]|nr:DUF2889 domain-containing protein [Mycobacteriales bacterium]
MSEMTAVDLPLPGPHAPTTSVPARRPGSVRRTSTIDMQRPDALMGTVRVDARARDLLTGPDGEIADVAEQRLEADVTLERTIAALRAAPAEPALDALVGISSAGGFRRAALRAAPEHAAASTLLNLLLDDLPAAGHVGGFSIGHAAQVPGPMHDLMVQHGPQSGTPDLCAGWAEGGGIMTFLRREGLPPVLTGPPAPVLAGADDDPDAWHARPTLTTHAVRRARMLDVWTEGDVVHAHSLFRDSHVDGDGRETVIHEYTLDATLDLDGTITGCDAQVRVLPWQECPQAIGSARRVIGTSARDLRDRVRHTFTGTSTCTHLNDQLRSLEDVPALAARLT